MLAHNRGAILHVSNQTPVELYRCIAPFTRRFALYLPTFQPILPLFSALSTFLTQSAFPFSLLVSEPGLRRQTRIAGKSEDSVPNRRHDGA